MPINTLIPADQLHWCEEEKAYRAISKEEAQKVARLCEDLTDMEKVAVVMEYQQYKVQFLLWENFLKGRIKIKGIRDSQPLFVPVDL